MAQVERTSTGMRDPNGTDLDATIADLRNKLVSNRIIYAADINQLINLWNRFNDHYHITDDLYGIDNYGNASGYGGTGVYDTQGEGTYRLDASGVTNAGDMAVISTNDIFSAGKHNEISAKFNSANGHKHYFDDRTS